MDHPRMDSSHTLEDGPYIGAPMYGCRGTLRWVPMSVFFKLPMHRRMATFIRSPKTFLFKKLDFGQYNFSLAFRNGQINVSCFVCKKKTCYAEFSSTDDNIY